MIEIKPVATVKNRRTRTTDDFWGGVVSEIVLAESLPDEVLEGIEEFSHLEIVFHFHLAKPAGISLESRHPRNNTDWPKVGLFAQRNKNRPNQLGLTMVKLVDRVGRSLLVEGLDAVDGTPVIDIKPVVKEFLPVEKVRQPEWVSELMRDYFSME